MQINIPGSKSLTQRYLILASNAKSSSVLKNLSNSDDSIALMNILKQTGVKFSQNSNSLIVVPPKNLSYPENTIFYCQNGGTTLRFSFLIPFVTKIPAIFDVSNQLKNRPHDAMFEVIKILGGKTIFLQPKSKFPFKIIPPAGKIKLNKIKIDCSETGQVFSSFLLWGHLLNKELEISCKEKVVSSSYIDLTLKTLQDFNISYEINKKHIKLKQQSYFGQNITCEVDMSLLPFVILASDITHQTYEVKIFEHFRQKDVLFEKFYKKIKNKNVKTIDLQAFPDLLPPLIIASIVWDSQTTFTGITHTSYKESNRKQVLAKELAKLGFTTFTTGDSLCVKGEMTKSAVLDAHGDHRMAMAFGLLKLINSNIKIIGKESVSKSWEGFWNELTKFKPNIK